MSDPGGRGRTRKQPTPPSRSHSCAVAARSPCAAGESLHSATLTLPGAFQNPLGIGPPSAEEIPSMSPASSRYQRSRSSQTLQDQPEDDPPQGAQPDPETLSDSSLAREILSQQPRNKTRSASPRLFPFSDGRLSPQGDQPEHLVAYEVRRGHDDFSSLGRSTWSQCSDDDGIPRGLAQ